MANLRAKYLYPDEINAIVTPLLADAFKPFGYKDLSIKEDETFDGDSIIRVTADVAKPVPVDTLSKIQSLIYDALRAKNEERFIFLSAPGPDLDLSDGDSDEEDLD